MTVPPDDDDSVINPIADPFVEVPDSDATSDLVLLEATEEGAVTVTLNRPQKKNAFDFELIGALRETFETLRDQEQIRVVFVQGAGGTFSAGADLEWMRDAVEHSEEDNKPPGAGRRGVDPECAARVPAGPAPLFPI